MDLRIFYGSGRMLQLRTESKERRELFKKAHLVGRHYRFPLAVPGRSHERARGGSGQKECNLQNPRSALVQSGNKCLRPGAAVQTRNRRWRNDDVTQQSNDYRPLGGRDPEIRYTAIGLPVVSFSVATEEPYFDKNGERRERTEWHRVVVVAKLALVCQEHLKKGRQIYVEGRLHTSATIPRPRSPAANCGVPRLPPAMCATPGNPGR